LWRSGLRTCFDQAPSFLFVLEERGWGREREGGIGCYEENGRDGKLQMHGNRFWQIEVLVNVWLAKRGQK